MTDLVPLPVVGDPLARLLTAYLDGLRSETHRRHLNRDNSPFPRTRSHVPPRIRHQKRRIYLNSYGTAGQST